MNALIDEAKFKTAVDTSRQGLREIADFGPNPGNLQMYVSIPTTKGRPLPLVVVLHGCGQTAHGYDQAAGWSRLAAAHGFLLLYPEQRRTNNRDGCFQWFEASHIQRGRGEVASIRQMIAVAIDRFCVDPTKVYVNGLSAGGAMAGAMLATYPEIFAAGAIIAGLPYGTALSLSEARQSMAGRTRDAKAWGDLVRFASPSSSKWPSVAVWHGEGDQVVNPVNAGELVKQWTNVHGIGAAVPAEDHVGRVIRRTWRDAEGRLCVIDYSVPDLAHGAPVDDPRAPAPFFLPAGISSTKVIARDWGLLDPIDERDDDDARTRAPRPKTRRGFWSRLGL